MKFWRQILLSLLLILAGAGGFLALNSGPEGEFSLGDNPDLPTLDFYTSSLATTPQLGFWHAVTRGGILDECNIRVHLWKNLDDLRGALLAGKGDLWLGHTDGFVQAARRGAPVQLMITSGWRKFYLVSKDPEKARFQDFQGKELAVAPPGSPAVPVLNRIMADQGPGIVFISHEPRQLAMKLVKGDLDSALLPEPLVSTLLARVKDLDVGENLETAYGRSRQGPSRMPIAGIAVNAKTAARYPRLFHLLADEILAHSREIEKDPQEGIKALPEQFKAFVRPDTIAQSLGRDLVFSTLSSGVEREIMDYIAIILPCSKAGAKTSFPLFWR